MVRRDGKVKTGRRVPKTNYHLSVIKRNSILFFEAS